MVESPGIAHNGDDERETKTRDSNNASNVEKQEGPQLAQANPRTVQEAERADRQDDAHSRRPNAQAGQAEHSVDTGRQKDLRRDDEIRRKNAESYERAHIPRQGQTAEQENKSHHVENMIDIVAVARALLVSDPGHGAVQAVPEPV